MKPQIPPLEAVSKRLSPSYERGILTNGPLVRELEEAAAERLGTAHVVAVSSCTSALMLVLRAFGLQGSVVVPSFTFSATVQALTWNGLDPAFVDCDALTFQAASDSVEAASGAAVGLIATHIFGAPSPVETLEEVARRRGIPLLFDAAHGFGARRRGRPIGGFGTAEVFSMSPTKPLVAGEGGLVSTNDAELASAVRDARNYGDRGDYDPRLLGLNARMSEMHAALALEGLVNFDENLARRRRVAQWYRDGLRGIAGVTCQEVDDADESTYKDLAILIEPEEFGSTREVVAAALRDEGVETRRYFSPPVHRQRFYRERQACHLPRTDRVASRVVNLPIYPSLEKETIFGIVGALRRIQAHAEEVSVVFDRRGPDGSAGRAEASSLRVGTGGRGYR
ncbi:MAG TPA: DegT/DnrJ/EryC1/StrS family aminotransferase [Acidimicrobiales bacterium]|nr:DegT/DnrJ/EryC1/StrS family aminotransferase [Acidimicrobiales bacterium]